MFFKQLEHIQLQSEKGRERRREKILELERWWSEIKVLVSQHFKKWEASDRMRLCSNEIRCRPSCDIVHKSTLYCLHHLTANIYAAMNLLDRTNQKC